MFIQKAYSDNELLVAVRDNTKQDDAIRFIYRAYYKTSENYILQNNGSEQDAEDIFQEVVVSFIQLVKDDKFRGECSAGTFIYTLTRHTWLNEIKRKGRAKMREEKYDKSRETSVPDISNWIESRESRSVLTQLVESLGKTCKQILLAFYYDNLSIKEILTSLDYENEQVVRNKKYKCLKQLEQSISGDSKLIKSLKSILYYE